MQLWIGNKNYSSWSMRPWVLMRHFGLPFEEVMVRFDDGMGPGSDFKKRIGAISPAARVPVLVDGALTVWDTQAIAETLAEKFPAQALWPRDAARRARARSLCAEMHAGFGALRTHCPMNIELHAPEIGQRVLAEQPAVAADLARITAMWGEALAAHGGPFLFGEFGIVDAYYAPVVMRMRSYALPLPAAVQAYADRVAASPAVAAWIADALAEKTFVAEDEPYRKSRT
jgi:glutathione S-transferase